jgi:hypothetical protein
MRLEIALLVLPVTLAHRPALAFVPEPRQSHRIATRISPSTPRWIERSAPDHHRSDKSDMSGLRFAASTTYKSRDVPVPSDGKDIAHFFDMNSNNHFLLLAKGTRNDVRLAEDRNVSKYLARWIEEAEQLGAAKPDLDDKLIAISVKTPFLVFVINVVATLGVKLLLHEQRSLDDNSIESSEGRTLLAPEYQFTLLEQSVSADGPPPLLFIFNQLTGINRKVKGTYVQPNHALFRVEAIPSPDRKRLSFVSHMTAELNIRFPRVLLNLLPVPKEQIEKQGSVNLERNMRRDVPPGVDLFRKAYLRWQRRK